MSHKTHTLDGILEMAVMYKNGVSCAEISEKTGVHYTHIWQFIKPLGIKSRWRTLDQDTINSIVTDYLAEIPLEDIVAKYNLSSKARVDQIIKSHRDLFIQYGIRKSDYLAMVEAQHNLCSICGKAETSLDSYGRIKSLGVDHNHISGKVRGLLCTRCNTMIGYARDNPSRLRDGAEYLKRTDGVTK